MRVDPRGARGRSISRGARRLLRREKLVAPPPLQPRQPADENRLADQVPDPEHRGRPREHADQSQAHHGPGQIGKDQQVDQCSGPSGPPGEAEGIGRVEHVRRRVEQQEISRQRVQAAEPPAEHQHRPPGERPGDAVDPQQLFHCVLRLRRGCREIGYSWARAPAYLNIGLKHVDVLTTDLDHAVRSAVLA